VVWRVLTYYSPGREIALSNASERRMAETLTKEKIEQLAPDQTSLGAALKLMKPASWPMLSRAADASLLWGECQGSGATPYRVIVSPDDLGYKCTCPSRKFPCKHVLAVMWMHCERPERFEPGASPDWVRDWLSRRRSKASTTPQTAGKTPKPGASMAAALQEAVAAKPFDPKAIARAEAQRQRLKEEREATVLAGLDELERWIVDQLNFGLAGFAQRAAQSVKTLSTRLVDAKASGLANRLDMLSADVFRVPEQMRGDLVFERLAVLALISSAYRNQDRLPPALRAGVRRTTGWAVKREELLADGEALRVSSDWIVAATLSEVQPDKLRRIETWLLNAVPAHGAQRVALLIDFVPVSSGPAGSPFTAGETLSGEVVFYPSAAPLRAQLATRIAGSPTLAWPELPEGLDAALGEYEAALARQPWLERWPLAARGIAVERIAPHQLALADHNGRALPIDRSQSQDLRPLLGIGTISALIAWDGRFGTLLAAETAIGRWHER
jgi:SWIM zinc finger